VLTNHVLQSTVFALAAGLLTLFLRNNHARTRYWIWLTASLKFLIPFSLFVELGHRFTWSSAPTISQPQLALVIDEVSQPFTIAAPAPIVSTPTTLSIFLPAIWICGSAAVLIFWLIRWHRAAALLRQAVPLTEGRELRALRRLDTNTKLISSRAQLEPGAFGIIRPVLYLPAGIADHLDDAQLDAIFAHELCHIRRRDNLTAALHMLVEAVFWFHPLTWWIGERLVDERERACDQEVVRLGSEPELYAATILQICKACLASPLNCVSGIGGSCLAKRIEDIMTNLPLNRLGIGKKMALASLAFLALITPIAIGILSVPAARAEAQASPVETTPLSTLPTFEAASVKENHSGPGDLSWGCRGIDGKKLSEAVGESLRLVGQGDVPLGRCVARNVPLKWLVSWAYQISWDQMNQMIQGGPEWFSAGIGSSERYDVDAKAAQPVARAQLYLMLQQLLADRFALKAHAEQKELPAYELTIGKGGPKLTKAPDDRDCSVVAVPEVPCHNFSGGFGSGLTGRSVSMADFAARLSRYTGDVVVDKTGLDGLYDIKTSDFWMPFPDAKDPGSVPTIFDMLQNQFGLKLKAGKDPVNVLVIDHTDKIPTGN